LLLLFLAAILLGLTADDWMDGRRVERLLFVGHSRTYHNDMPTMVAKMAKSAGGDVRYDVKMIAFAGATAKDHWESAKTQAALADGDWDKLVLQPDFVWRNDEPGSSGLFVYGKKILAMGAVRSQPAIISDWTFRKRFYVENDWSRSEHYDLSQSHYRALASETGSQLIDVARVWEHVRDKELPFSLYKDDDHPTLEGSYLVALVVYASLSHADVNTVTYAPWGMKDEDAALLRKLVADELS
jgi:hypothetical protein